jgi:hypothetical protein
MVFTLSARSDVGLVYDCLQIALGLRRPGCVNFPIASPRRFRVSRNCVKRDISAYHNYLKKSKRTKSVALLRERTIPTERLPLVRKVSASFCSWRGVA